MNKKMAVSWESTRLPVFSDDYLVVRKPADTEKLVIDVAHWDGTDWRVFYKIEK